MSAEEWEEIKRVFENALALPDGDREAHVEAACAGKPELCQVIRVLLAGHAAANQALESTVLVAPDSRVFAAGQLVARRFRILRFLDRGGMGEVYEAFDEKLEVRLALKTLRPGRAADADSLERFRREIRIAREVAHDNLCRVFDLIEHRAEATGETIPCLTMELLEGESLQSHLVRHRPLSQEAALPIVRQVATALDVLHDSGIVHRDLKPSNVMLVPRRDGHWRVAVMDFGLAKPLSEGRELFESSPEVCPGAPYFMAPELLRGERPTIASDIYALGLILDEMVTRCRAFSGDSLPMLYYQRLWERPLPPGSRSEGLSKPWQAAILRCLEADPGRRYARAGDLVHDLETATEEVAGPELQTTVPALGAAHPSVGHATARIPWRRGRKVLAAAVLAPVVAGGVAMAPYLQSRPLNTSVVVFPTENLNQRPDYEYLCRGTAAELMRRLNRVEGVRVIPFYEPRRKAPARLANARFLLETQLQVHGSRLRFLAQLVEAGDGHLVWADRFDGELLEPLQLQTDIAEGIVGALENRVAFGLTSENRIGRILARAATPVRRLLGLPLPQLPRPPTPNNAALDAYMQGQHYLAERRLSAALEASRWFQTALLRDPNFALAEAGLADMQWVLLDYAWERKEGLLREARRHADRAVVLDPGLPEAHLSLAAVRQTEWDWSGAEESYQTAIRLNPRLARAQRWHAGLLLQFGKFDEALEKGRHSLDLDPYDYPNQAGYGYYLFLAGQTQAAMAHLEHVLASKDFIYAHVVLGQVYAKIAASRDQRSPVYFQRAFREARAVADTERQSAASISPAPPLLRLSDWMFALFYSLAGDPRAAAPHLQRLSAEVAAGRLSPAVLAYVYTAMGRHDQAVAFLERAAETKDRDLLYVKVQPFFEPLHGSRRYQALLRRMGL